MRHVVSCLAGCACVLSASAFTNTVRITTFAPTGELAWTNAIGTQDPAVLSNIVYQVESTTNLMSGWQVIPGMEALRATNRFGSAVVPAGAGLRFFRVAVATSILADAAADFSAVQGANNWYYGYYDGTSATPWTTGAFKLMTQYIPAPGPGEPAYWAAANGSVWTALWADGGHPNGQITSGGRLPVQQWAVRRWVSPVSGSLSISCSLSDLSNVDGNGIIAHVIMEGAALANYVLPNGGQTNFNLVVPVVVGSRLDFAIDPTASNDLADGTIFHITIQR